MTETDFDTDRFAAWLRGVFGAAETPAIRRISGGQSNPTYFVSYGGRRMVLRKQPRGDILKGAHAIDREYRAMRALAETDVPVPRTIHYEDDREVLGTPFYLMEQLEGRVFDDCALPGMAPEERRGIYLAMAEAMARMHAVRPEDVGLEDFGAPGDYFARQVRRWSRQLAASPSGRDPALDALAAWLPENLPEDDGLVSVAHGDFRLGNLMFHPSEPKVIGILDWELSTLGHPMADLGFCCMTWHTSPDEYGGILGLDHAALGIPGRAEFVAHYRAHARSAPALTRFHVVFALFRFSVIFVGIADRARHGTAAGADAARLGPLAGAFARRAMDLVREGRSGGPIM